MKILLLFLAFTSFVFANIGKVSVVVGDAKIQRNNKLLIVQTGSVIEEKDIIRTAKNAKVQLIFNDNTIITVGKNSALDINEYLYDLKNPKNSKTDFRFFKGAFKAITGKIGKINKKRFKLRTKSATIGIRGTIVVGNQNIIACTQGGITVEGAGVSVNVNENELTVIQSNNAPSKAKEITTTDLKELENSIEPTSQNEQESSKEEAKKEDNSKQSESTEKESEKNEEPSNQEPKEEVKEEAISELSNDDEELQNDDESIVSKEDDTNDEEPIVVVERKIEEVIDDNSAQIQLEQNLVEEAVTTTSKVQEQKAKAVEVKTEVQTKLAQLPSNSDLTTLQTNSQTVVSTTQTSLNSAISSLNSSSSTNSVDSTTLNSINTLATTANTQATQATNDASTFQANVDGTYQTSLASAQTKANEAQSAYQTALENANTMQATLENAKANNASASTISKIQSEIQIANQTVIDTQTLANEAQALVTNLSNEISNTSTQLQNNASNASSLATTLNTVSTSLTYLEGSKQSNIDATNTKAQTEVILNTLPTNSDLTTLQTNSQTVVSTTQTSLSSAIASLTNASNTNNSSQDAVNSISTLLISANTQANQVKSNANSFQTSASTTYKQTLDSAELKANEATTAYNNAVANAQNLQKNLDTIKEQAAQSSSNVQTFSNPSSSSQTITIDYQALITTLEASVQKANEMVELTKNTKDQAQALVNDLRTQITATSTQLQNDASSATTLTENLTLISNSLIYLEASKQSSTNAVNSKTQTQIILNTLPSSDDLNSLQTQSENTSTSTQTSLNTAITSLQNATASNSVNSAEVTNISNLVTSTNATSTNIQNGANTFQASANGVYKTTLDSAQIKANEAVSAYNTALTNVQNLQTNLTNAQTDGLDAAIITSLQQSLTKANEVLNLTKNTKDEALALVNDLKTLIDATANKLNVNSALIASNAQTISKLSSLLASLEDTKQASLDVDGFKTDALNAKNQVQTASSDATNASSDLLNAKQNIATTKSEVITLSNDVNSATSTATNSGTANTQVGFSAKIAEDKSSEAQIKASQAVAQATIAANKLAQAQTAVNNANTQYQASVSALNSANTKLSQAQTALNSAITMEASVNSSNSEAKTAALNAVVKAQALYDSAVIAKNEAQTAVNNASAILTALDGATLIANLTTANNEAQADASNATTLASNAQTTAQSATNAAKTASTNVKTAMLAKTKTTLSEDGTVIDNSTHTFKLSGEKTNEILIGQSFGGYNGSTQLGTYRLNDSSTEDLFNVQVDNLQEFFVVYNSSTNPNKSLTTYGNAASGLSLGNIYVYKNFKTLDVNGGSGSFSSGDTISFYNPATNSFTSFSKDFYKEGANAFVAGNSSEVKVIKNTFNLYNSVFLSNINSKTSTSGTNKISGSQGQGNTQTVNFDDGSKQVSASFLTDKKNQDGSDINKSLSGKAFLISHDPDNTTGNRIENINISIVDNGVNGISINATAKYGNGNTITSFSGTTKADTLTAYYINSDIWGAKASSGNGFMMAVPDGGYDSNGKFTLYDENDNPLTSDDDSSWGYWTGVGTMSNGGSINPRSAWVAGIETSTADVQNLFNGTSQTLTFNGKVMGAVNSVNPIVMDDTNKVVLNFDVGGGSASMNGNMQFKDTKNHSFNLNLEAGNMTVNNSGFSGKFTGTNVDPSFNHVNGKYYGNGSVKSVGGSFTVRQNNQSAFGVFKATKQ